MRAAAAAVIAFGLAGRVCADELGRVRPRVRLDIAACFDDRDAVLRAVQIELGDDALAGDAGAVAVRVDCAADGVDAGVVVEVRPPDSPRRYRYALDWRAQPVDARPRLVGLAVAEAVDASRIELTAVPEPAVPGGSAARPTLPPPGPSDWTIALVGSRRAFSAPSGVDLLGAGLSLGFRRSHRLRFAADLLAEGTTAVTTSGAISVLSLSSAPRLVVHAGGRFHGELGLGARIGLATFSGQALPGSRLAGRRIVRAWLGPAASLALGTELTSTVSLRASIEVGRAVIGGAASDLGTTAAAVDGTWTSLGVAAVLAL